MLNDMPFVHDEEAALKELYPNGFVTSKMTSCCIIAVKNVSTKHESTTKVEFALKENFVKVDDDPHCILSNTMTENILNQFGNGGLPPHNLQLKVRYMHHSKKLKRK